jgi:hypothetical protein
MNEAVRDSQASKNDVKHEVIQEISNVEEESRVNAMSPSVQSMRDHSITHSQTPVTNSKQTEVEMVTLTEETKSRDLPTQMGGN